MIQTLKTVNLNRSMNLDLTFHDDINIITGKNGSGKTTLLKLLWYAISGNLERILREIPCDSFELVTDEFMVGMAVDTNEAKQRTLKLRYRIGNGNLNAADRPLKRGMDWDDLATANRLISACRTSIYFPTYRRIEGGISSSVRELSGRSAYGEDFRNLKQSLSLLSQRLSVDDHRFVASISTDDIESLLTSKYAEISEQTNRLNMQLSSFILKQVSSTPVAVGHGGNDDFGEEEPSREALFEIQQRARDITAKSELLLKPFTVLSELITKVFRYKGIHVADSVTLGETIGAITSDVLSAGEKQMLSFFCYNAFSSDSCLFIDEPEISLHVDWQRILFPLLLKQSMGNQFIVATHSPFIYSKYADKELVLDSDRGNADADADSD
jgi:predicted ATPase